MQTVDILSNDCGKLPHLFQLGQGTMSLVRLSGKAEHPFPVEMEKFFWMLAEKGVAQNRFRWKAIRLAIQSIDTAEIWDAAFCRNAGTSKKYNPVAFRSRLAKDSYMAIHPF